MGAAIGTLATLASVGLQIADASGAFDDSPPRNPSEPDPRVADQRQKRIRAARAAKGASGTVLTSLVSEPAQTAPATLLGQAGADAGG